MWTGLYILLAIIVVGYVIAFTRKGRVASTQLGTRREQLQSAADPAIVFARIASIADGKLKVDDQDATKGIVVLSSGVTFNTWGFLYPIHITADSGGSKIEIGIQSKFFQFGPLVTRAHQHCVDSVRQALSVPAARIA